MRSLPGHRGHDCVASSSLSLSLTCSRNGSHSSHNCGSNRGCAGSRWGTVAMIIASWRCRGRSRAVATVTVAVAIAVATIAMTVVMTLLLPWPSSPSRGHCHCHHHCLRLRPRPIPPIAVAITVAIVAMENIRERGLTSWGRGMLNNDDVWR